MIRQYRLLAGGGAIVALLLAQIGLAGCHDIQPLTDPCRPRSVIATRQQPTSFVTADGSKLMPSCTVQADGTVVMSFQSPACPDSSKSWFAGCTFAANQDLTSFDAANSGQGILAVDLCVENFPPSSLNLRYGSPMLTAVGRTKYMPLIDGAERFSGTGCRLVYLAPADACYSSTACGQSSGCAPATADAPTTCDTFDSSELTLMNEFCDETDASPAGPTTVTIRKITYFPASCACRDDSACFAPNVCRRDGWPAGAKCAQRTNPCPGVCTE